MKKRRIRGIVFCFCLACFLWIAPIWAEESPGGYFVGGPSETLHLPRLDLQRAPYGIFEEKQPLKPFRRVQQAKPLTPIVKEVPTVAEVEASRAKATAESALEVSRKAEAVANTAQATSEEAIAAANEAITKANQAIDKTNQTIDKVNEINRNLTEEIARLRFELTQKDQDLEKQIAKVQEDLEKLKKSAEAVSQEANTYRVKRGDSLSKIAARIYKNPERWRQIYNANRKQIKNPNLIYPGQVLNLPTENPDGKLSFTTEEVVDE